MIMNYAKFLELNSGILVDATLDYRKNKVHTNTNFDVKKSMVAVVDPNKALTVSDFNVDKLTYVVCAPTDIITYVNNCMHFKTPIYFVKQADGSYMIAYKQPHQRLELTELFNKFLDSYMRWFNEKQQVNKN